MPFNPERMRPTEASLAPVVKEANQIVFFAISTILQEKSDTKTVIAANNFLKGVKQFPS